jgi:cobalamin biosynthesis protein CobD/CbiB
VDLSQEKNYDGNPSSVDHGVCGQHDRWICFGQRCDDVDRYHSGLGHVVARDTAVISSAGMFASAVISAVISLHTNDLMFLFYSLVFCALGIFLEGYERGRKG